MTEVAQLPVEQEKAILQALKQSLYPGAADESVYAVLNYCRAAKLDPMTKPVHIVPMWIKEKGSDKGSMRDVIMPGINLYRVNAERTGDYVGQSEPEFGPIITLKLGGKEVSVPEWCKITVRKRVEGIKKPVKFTAIEYWLENYATAGRDTEAPNAMWSKRPYGQLAKCAEAQALRKAFPDSVGAQPTAEEMAGKTMDDINPDSVVSEQSGEQSRPAAEKQTTDSLRDAMGVSDKTKSTEKPTATEGKTTAQFEALVEALADASSKQAVAGVMKRVNKAAEAKAINREQQHYLVDQTNIKLESFKG